MQPAIFDTDAAAAPLVARFPNDALRARYRSRDRSDGVVRRAVRAGRQFPDPRPHAWRVQEVLRSDAGKRLYPRGEGERHRAGGFLYRRAPNRRRSSRPTTCATASAIARSCSSRTRFWAKSSSRSASSAEFRALAQLPTRMLIPALDPFFMELIEEPDVSLTRIHARADAEDVAGDTRARSASWLVKVLGEIYRVLAMIERRDHLPPVRR